MAITTDSDMIRAVQNRRALQRDAGLRALGAAPGTFASAVREGPSAAAAYAESWRQQPRAPVDKMAIEQAKANLVNMAAELDKAKLAVSKGKADAHGAYRTELAKQDVALMQSALTALTHDREYAAQMAQSWNQRRTELGINTANNWLAPLKQILGAGSDAAVSKMWDLVTGSGVDPEKMDTAMNWANPDTAHGVYAALQTADPATKRAILVTADIATRASTGMGLRELMNTGQINFDGDPAAAAEMDGILHDFAENESEIVEIANGVQNLQAAQEDAVTKDLVKGIKGVNPDDVVNLYKKMKSAILDGDPEEAIDAMDDASHKASAAPPGSPESMAGVAKLLGDLEDIENNPGAPQTAREAKQDILRSDWFKQWKQSNYGTDAVDDQSAFRALNQWVSAQVKERKMLAATREREAGGAKNFKAPAMPTEAKFAPGADPKQIMLDDDFNAYRQENGQLVDVSEQEYDDWLKTFELEGQAKNEIIRANQAFKEFKAKPVEAPKPAAEPAQPSAIPPVVQVVPNRKTAAQIAQSVLAKKRKFPTAVAGQ